MNIPHKHVLDTNTSYAVGLLIFASTVHIQ